jgi:type II secretory pathway predicted ATPase ExeA
MDKLESKTPAELMSGVQIANAPSVFNRVENEHMELTTKSSKEQIIDDLHEENLRLKEKLERLRNNSGKIE